MPSGTSTKFTYDDYLLFPEGDLLRHEIIDGEHYASPAPPLKHQEALQYLLFALEMWRRQTRLGHLFIGPLAVVLSEFDVVEPDLLYISNERDSIITEKYVQGAPDLTVEVLSDSSRKTDEIIKRKRHEHFGVAEYWIIDPVLDSIKIYRRSASAFERVAELSTETGGRIETPLLPGFRWTSRISSATEPHPLLTISFSISS